MTWKLGNSVRCVLLAVGLVLFALTAEAASKGAGRASAVPFPPVIPGGKEMVTDDSPLLLSVPDAAKANLVPRAFVVAKTPPTIDFMYYPGQTHKGNPWSDWGDGCTTGTKYYSAIGDHKYEAYVYEYDATTQKLRMLLDVKTFLEPTLNKATPDELDYTPGKIHSRIDVGKDGWLYYATHRGSDKYTDGAGGEAHHYKGDWVLRTNPETNQTEIISWGPVGKESMPVSVLDPDRMIFYGGTEQNHIFFALDCATKKVLYQSEPGIGPDRYFLLAQSTGKVYFGSNGGNRLARYDPATNKLDVLNGDMGMRAATKETPDGFIYTTDSGTLWRFDVKTEKSEDLGSLTVGKENYITTLDADPTGRFLYYCAGAHGGAALDGTPIVQYDLKTKTRKVLAFLSQFYHDKYGDTPDGTFNMAVSPDGSILYATFNGVRSGAGSGAKYWDGCTLFVIHIPESERKL